MEEPADTKLDAAQVRACLDEIDAELFKVADNEQCQRFHKDTQLTAVVLLLLRASSLMRPLLGLFESLEFDAFDAVLRAWEEDWRLAHELRLSASADKAAAWLRGDNDAWSAKIAVLVEFAKGRGHPGPTFGRDYGLLSELAHPTRTAAENSVTLGGIRKGIDGARAEIAGAEKNNVERIRNSLYRLIWLIGDQDAQFIKFPVDVKKMPASEKFLAGYDHIEPGT